VPGGSGWPGQPPVLAGNEREVALSKEIFSPATLPPPAGYSHVAKVNKGTLV
jgi:hypothetical protein